LFQLQIMNRKPEVNVFLLHMAQNQPSAPPTIAKPDLKVKYLVKIR
jgi:hypothetical protein